MKNILSNATFRVHAAQIPGMIRLKNMNKLFDNSGFMSNFFLLLQECLGFRYEITTLNLTERIAYLKQNKIDLSLPLVQTFERSKIMDFSQPFTIEAVRFIIGKPPELSKVTAILRPFLLQVWIAIFLTFVISVIIFSIIFRNEAKLYKRKNVNIIEIAWALFGSFTNQGNDFFFPSGKSCQLLVSGWLLAIFIITSSYSGALMSFITFPGQESVPRTFSELVKMASNGNYIISSKSNGSITKFISESTDGVGLNLKKLFELNKIKYGWLNHNLANRILKEKYAYIFYDNALDIFISIFGSENFLISEDQLFSTSVGFGISKKFPYKKELNEAILRCVEAGFWMKFKRNEEMKADKNHQSIIEESADIFHALNIVDLAGPLLLLIIGYTLSIIAFLFEISVGNLCR